MILVLLGTQNNSFSRLLLKIDSLIKNGSIKDKVIVQAGHTKFNSENMEIFDFIPKDKMDTLISEADLIITHGGVGSIIKGIKLEKKVIAVPRLKEYGEHVNNHQIQIIENFDYEGYIKGVFDLENLKNVIENIEQFLPTPFNNQNSKIIEIIENYIDNN